MAGQGTSSQAAIDLSDPMFKDLTESQLAAISQMISKQILEAMKNIRITTVNPNIPVPEYNEYTMTSETFFKRCVDYFRSQGFQPSQYHEVIGPILTKNMQMWHDSVASSIKSWDDFCLKFKDRYDGAMAQEKRKKRLYTRVQKEESVEQYVHEMVNLARQIDPNEPEALSVSRAFQGLVPDLVLAIGELQVVTVNNLIQKADRAVELIRARDRQYGKYTKLPLVYGYEERNYENEDEQGSDTSAVEFCDNEGLEDASGNYEVEDLQASNDLVKGNLNNDEFEEKFEDYETGYENEQVFE